MALRRSQKVGGTLNEVRVGEAYGFGRQLAARIAGLIRAGAKGQIFTFVIARKPARVLGDCQSPGGLASETSEDRMSQQTIRQQARRTAREMADKRRAERAERERRVIELAEQVMVAIGERDAAVSETEKRAGKALRDLTVAECLSLGEAVEWCGESLTVREARRLRQLGFTDERPAAAGPAGRGAGA